MGNAGSTRLARLAARAWTSRYLLVYCACLLGFTAAVGRFADRHTGFSSLIQFGDRFASRRLPQLSDIPLYTYAQDGYDGQFYAQVAVAGNPLDPLLRRALDSPSYRERRLLVPLLAYVVGLGRPAAVVQVYALFSLVCLWVLAALLARWWFPPTDLSNLLRWAGTVFGAGMVVGVTRSLVDPPALLLVALAARAIERDRIWHGAIWLALAGLARETSLLAAAAFWSSEALTKRGWRRATMATLACAAPTLLWLVFLARHYGHVGGMRNFAAPLSTLAFKVREIEAGWRSRGPDAAVVGETLGLIGMIVQLSFVAGRPRPVLVWWRIGAPFAVLWTFLGIPVWEGFPSAAARAVLPLTMAFNRLVPRTRRGLALLVAGNLSVLSIVTVVESAVPSEQTRFVDGVRTFYGPGWYPFEHGGRHTWRWASGPATLTLKNPNREPRRVTLDFGLASVSPRTITITSADGTSIVRQWKLPTTNQLAVSLGPLELPPGETSFVFSTDVPPSAESTLGGRELAFSVHDLYATVMPVTP